MPCFTGVQRMLGRRQETLESAKIGLRTRTKMWISFLITFVANAPQCIKNTISSIWYPSMPMRLWQNIDKLYCCAQPIGYMSGTAQLIQSKQVILSVIQTAINSCG